MAAKKPGPDLESRVQKLEQQLTALLVLSMPTILEGRHVPKCRCRKLATKEGVINHPREGRHTFQLCDDCKPEHPYLGLPGSKITYVETFNPKSLAEIRRLNEALKCAP